MATDPRAQVLPQLAALPDWLRAARRPQLYFLAYGFLPIGCLSLALQDAVPLRWTAQLLVVPATAVALVLALRSPHWGRRAGVGLAAGMAAVAAYDVVRGAFVLAGAMPDPIPNIGRMALDDPTASWLWGYLWRFVWNGGAMGIAFAMLPFRGVRAGVAFGLAVCGCLFATLLASPIAQHRFLALTPFNVAVALVGHAVYGAVLGAALERLERPAPAGRPRLRAWPRALAARDPR
jgi:hypothetical protein